MSTEHARHNLLQRAYFEVGVKPTMVPADTPYLRRHVDEVVREAGLSPGDRVLEVGCGMGRYTLLLAARGLRVTGLDLSPVLLDRLRAYNAGRHPLELHAADVTEPPTELFGRFRSVIGFFVLHHLDSLVPCFRSVVRLLEPGGRAVFLEPNPYNPLYYVQILVTPGMSFRGESGLVDMRRRVVFDAFEAASLRGPRLRRFGFFPPFLSNRRWGAALERGLERVGAWRFALPFQVFSAGRG